MPVAVLPACKIVVWNLTGPALPVAGSLFGVLVVCFIVCWFDIATNDGAGMGQTSRKADFLLRPVRPHYGGQVAPSPPLARSARGHRGHEAKSFEQEGREATEVKGLQLPPKKSFEVILRFLC